MTNIKEITYRKAYKNIKESECIAELIMEAMSDDCCKYFYGEKHTAKEFHNIISELVYMEDSQYSYKNTIVATINNEVIGIAVSYNGKDLEYLRLEFINKIRSIFNKDFSNIENETQEGELYLDSFAVKQNFRKMGIGSNLINLIEEKAKKIGIPCIGLLVDISNINARNFYKSKGFKYIDENIWGDHVMNHLQKNII